MQKLGVKNKRRLRRNLNRLTNQQRAFVFELLSSKTYCPTKAARTVGYKRPASAADRLLKNRYVASLIEQSKKEREERTKLTSDDVWRYIHTALMFDPADVYESDGDGWWVIRDLHDIPKVIRQLIVGVESTVVRLNDVGRPMIKVKFIDKAAILAIAARHSITEPARELKLTLDLDEMTRRIPQPSDAEVIDAHIIKGPDDG